MTIAVELVYSAAPRQIERVTLQLCEGATLAEALQASGVLQRHGLAADGLQCGIWGRQAPPSRALRDGDRVEVYRPLEVDPKEARRRRHAGQRGPKTKRPAGAGR
ncbi:MAG: RnfH family protein [Aquincola sp.]|nr:RnfH family protein [Aquincola sp.]MDH4290853.1 RnfH family protein [Aquincola sp.]MDH5329954.1 RnfH family protein [Aquincola sp.]